MTAADRLRESVNALPEGLRSAWTWDAEDGEVGTVDEIAVSTRTYGGHGVPAAAHIALTASPDRVLALADLLDAIHDLAAYDRGVVIDGYARDETYRRYTAHVAEVLERRDRWAAMIEGSTE